jgi:hypothetical protein
VRWVSRGLFAPMVKRGELGASVGQDAQSVKLIVFIVLIDKGYRFQYTRPVTRPRFLSEAPVEIDQVETFLAVVTYGGFHRAAEALRVSQPAISARIRALEDSLRVKLFSRETAHITLSPAGKALRPHAEQLFWRAKRYTNWNRRRADCCISPRRFPFALISFRT